MRDRYYNIIAFMYILARGGGGGGGGEGPVYNIIVLLYVLVKAPLRVYYGNY